MPDDEVLAALPPARAGSGADLARRMDRMEGRQDTAETELRALTATVIRVEQNQSHATELNKLRFDALDTGLKSVAGHLADFTRRIEGVLTGEVETAQTRQGQRLLQDYMEWRKSIDEHVDEAAAIHAAAAGRDEGIGFVLRGGKALVVAAAALAGPIVAFIAVLLGSQ